MHILVSIALVFIMGYPTQVSAEATAIATPEATAALPAATAPFELGTVMLPDNEAGITALVARLPAAVAQQSRVPAPGYEETGRFIAAYGAVDRDFGSPLTLQALNLATGDFFPKDFTVADFVASATDPASDYHAVAFGQDGTLAWVRAETTAAVEVNHQGTPASRRTIYTLAWGEVTSPWLFTAAAFSPKGLDALVSAFVATAKTQPATPAMEATPVG